LRAPDDPEALGIMPNAATALRLISSQQRVARAATIARLRHDLVI